MKFGNFVSFLFLIYETSYHLVTEQNDCIKLYNFARKDNKVYSDDEC